MLGEALLTRNATLLPSLLLLPPPSQPATIPTPTPWYCSVHDLLLDDAALASMSDAALEAQTEALLERLLTEMIKMASEEDGLTLEVCVCAPPFVSDGIHALCFSIVCVQRAPAGAWV